MIGFKRILACSVALTGFAISLFSVQAYAAPSCSNTLNNPATVPMTQLNGTGTCVQFGDKLFGNFNLTNLIAAGGANVVFSTNGDAHNIGFDATGTYITGANPSFSYEVDVNQGINTITAWAGDIDETTGNESVLTKVISPVNGGSGGTINCVANGTPVAPQVSCPQIIPVNGIDEAVSEAEFIGTTAQVSAVLDTIIQSTTTINLSDSEQPGSVIVYPKFVNELFGGGSPIIVDGVAVPQTEIEIGAVCPPAFIAGGGFCPEHQPIKIRFHWVCPGTEGVNSNICPEEDFEVNITVPGKLAFSANGLPINTNSPPLVPAPPCARGYLIGWVINPANDLPIKFDGLIGNAVIRNPNLVAGPHAGMSTGLSAYNAVPIQADPALANLAPVPAASGGSLPFGITGGYATVTGVQIGDVRFDKTAAGSPLPNILSRTNLNFLTLDVRSNAPNDPTFVNLDFWNESLGLAVGSSNPAFEHLTSTFREFVCWDQVPLSALAGGDLTQAFQGTRKGVVIAGPAQKVRDGNAPGDTPGPVTLIGLVETIEGTAANDFLERKYNFNMSNDSNPVPTAFVP